VRLSPETCRVKPLRRIKTQLLHLVGLISLLWFHCACRYERCQCYGGICRHNTDSARIEKHSGTIRV